MTVRVVAGADAKRFRFRLFGAQFLESGETESSISLAVVVHGNSLSGLGNTP